MGRNRSWNVQNSGYLPESHFAKRKKVLMLPARKTKHFDVGLSEIVESGTFDRGAVRIDADICDFKKDRRTEKMKHSVKSLLVAAAMTGLLGATAMPVAMADDKPATTDTKDTKTTKKAKSTKKAAAKDSKDAAKDKNSCKSANGCSSKDDKKN